MEKLILKSVMYGVDKVPDAWFDKVPGGFYKAKDKDKTKAGQKPDGGESGKKQRRYSHHHDDRRRTRRDRYEEEYRSDDNRRQDRRGRSSYDGSHDEDFTGTAQRGARDDNRRRRRHSVDSEQYGQNHGSRRAPDDAYYGERKPQPLRRARAADPYFDERQRPMTGESSRSANAVPPQGAAAGMGAGFAAAAAAESGAPYPQTRPGSTVAASMPSPPLKPTQPPPGDQSRSGSVTNAYVPYAHIYGRPNEQRQPSFAPPPTFAPRPSATFPMPQPASGTTAPQAAYPQNPLAQQAPTAADAGAGAQHTGQPVAAPQPMSAGAFTGYENKPPYPESPRSSRAAERYSPPYASQPRRDSDVLRARSERRSDDADRGAKDQGRDRFVDPRTALQGQINVPPPPPGPPPGAKDSRRDSAYGDRPRSQRHNDRGYTSD